MQKLIEGLQRFMTTVYEQERRLFLQLAFGQAPQVLFITCSDSRIDPNLLTQTSPGDLFVLRNAGNIVPAYGAPGGGEAATVEFAVCALKVKHIVVCGHSGCGALGALLDPASAEGLPAVQEWLKHAEATRRIAESFTDVPENERRGRIAEAHVLVQLAHLETHPSVAAARARDEIRLHGWLYDIPRGQVRVFDAKQGEFISLLGTGDPPSTP